MSAVTAGCPTCVATEVGKACFACGGIAPHPEYPDFMWAVVDQARVERVTVVGLVRPHQPASYRPTAFDVVPEPDEKTYRVLAVHHELPEAELELNELLGGPDVRVRSRRRKLPDGTPLEGVVTSDPVWYEERGRYAVWCDFGQHGVGMSYVSDLIIL